MITIELYQPKKVNATVNFPTHWNELTTQEIITISNIILTCTNAEWVQFYLFYALLESRIKSQKIKLCKGWKQLLDKEQLATETKEVVEFIIQKNNLTKQPFTTLNVGFKVVGPQDAFTSLTCAEFEEAEVHYLQFKQKPNEEALINLAAVLFRPKNQDFIYFNKRKHQFVQYNYEKELPHFKKLEPKILYSIFTWYDGCRSQLPQMFPNLYSGENKNHNTEIDFFSFTKCIHAAAGEKNGSRTEIRRMKLLELFFDMEQETIKSIELKQQYEK